MLIPIQRDEGLLVSRSKSTFASERLTAKHLKTHYHPGEERSLMLCYFTKQLNTAHARADEKSKRLKR